MITKLEDSPLVRGWLPSRVHNCELRIASPQSSRDLHKGCTYSISSWIRGKSFAIFGNCVEGLSLQWSIFRCSAFLDYWLWIVVDCVFSIMTRDSVQWLRDERFVYVSEIKNFFYTPTIKYSLYFTSRLCYLLRTNVTIYLKEVMLKHSSWGNLSIVLFCELSFFVRDSVNASTVAGTIPGK